MRSAYYARLVADIGAKPNIQAKRHEEYPLMYRTRSDTGTL